MSSSLMARRQCERSIASPQDDSALVPSGDFDPASSFSALDPKAVEFTELFQADAELRKIKTRASTIHHHIQIFCIPLTPTAA
jgi:hypothetical protein